MNALNRLCGHRVASQAKARHMHEAHPFEIFPIERIEAAVQAVPPALFPEHERRLLHFGPAFCYWCATTVATSQNDGGVHFISSKIAKMSGHEAL